MSPSGAFRNGSIPTVLLVHGAVADGSMWAGVVPELQGAGIGVIAVANPLRPLASDAAYVASIAAAIDGPVVLAGHSYGGAVITAAGAAAGNIAGLVYVAAYALEEGESALDICDRFPGSQLLAALRPGTFSDGSGDPCVELHIDHEMFAVVCRRPSSPDCRRCGGGAAPHCGHGLRGKGKCGSLEDHAQLVRDRD